jgi:hypothetical protein
MGLFLRLKHWQVFILTFGLFLVFFIYLAAPDLVSIVGNDVRDAPFVPITFGFSAPHIFLLYMVVANFWLFAVGTRLHKKYHYNNFMLFLFRISIYFSTLFAAATFVVLPAFQSVDGTFSRVAMIISLLGGIYCAYFASFLLRSIELKRDAAFRDLTRDFVFFVFSPVGIWWVQPRINRIFRRDTTAYDPNGPLDQQVTN